MVKITATQGLVTFLFVLVVFGALHLLANSFPDARLSKAWRGGLGF